jgi:hypothetical protein
MHARRVGILLFTLGLATAALVAVVAGPVAGGTDVGCPDHEPSYGLEDVDLSTLSVSYTDGCNAFAVRPLVTGGLAVAAVGTLVGLAGIGRELLTD